MDPSAGHQIQGLVLSESRRTPVAPPSRDRTDILDLRLYQCLIPLPGRFSPPVTAPAFSAVSGDFSRFWGWIACIPRHRIGTLRMIEFLRGRLAHRQPARLVIDVGGVGMGVDVSLRTAEQYPREGETVELITYLHVREESLELYGFQNQVEKTIFLKLLGVSGIGPRLALRILSAVPPHQLAQMILGGDIRGLTALKGIGKKTAEVMVASLRTSLSKMDLQTPVGGQAAVLDAGGEAARDAVLALVTLGVKDAAAQGAVQKALERLGDKANAGQLITQALQEV